MNRNPIRLLAIAVFLTVLVGSFAYTMTRLDAADRGDTTSEAGPARQAVMLEQLGMG